VLDAAGFGVESCSGTGILTISTAATNHTSPANTFKPRERLVLQLIAATFALQIGSDARMKSPIAARAAATAATYSVDLWRRRQLVHSTMMSDTRPAIIVKKEPMLRIKPRIAKATAPYVNGLLWCWLQFSKKE
jgi:hypothetical protein